MFLTKGGPDEPCGQMTWGTLSYDPYPRPLEIPKAAHGKSQQKGSNSILSLGEEAGRIPHPPARLSPSRHPGRPSSGFPRARREDSVQLGSGVPGQGVSSQSLVAAGLNCAKSSLNRQIHCAFRRARPSCPSPGVFGLGLGMSTGV